MSTGPTLTINRTTREVRLTRSPLGLQGIPGDSGFTADELAAIRGADAPNASNPFATMTIFDGFTRIVATSVLPDTPDPTTLYLLTG